MYKTSTWSSRSAWMCALMTCCTLAASCGSAGKTDVGRRSPDIADAPSGPYLSDSVAAYSDLEERQAAAYQTTRRPRPPILSQIEWRLVAEEIDATGFQPKPGRSSPLVAPLERPPTRWEDPITYLQLRQKVHLALKALHDLGVEIQPPAYGTLPIFGVNAESIPSGDTRIVVVDPSLSEFCYDMTAVAVDALGVEVREGQLIIAGDDEFEKRLRNDQSITNNLVAVLFNYSEAISGKRQAVKEPKPELEPMIEGVAFAIELFIVCHELAHTVLDHDSMANIRYRLPGAAETEIRTYSWEQEQDADIAGYRIMLRCLEIMSEELQFARDHKFISEFAPLMYFQYALMLEEAQYIRQYRRKPEPVGMDDEFTLKSYTARVGERRREFISKAATRPLHTKELLVTPPLPPTVFVDAGGYRLSISGEEQLRLDVEAATRSTTEPYTPSVFQGARGEARLKSEGDKSVRQRAPRSITHVESLMELGHTHPPPFARDKVIGYFLANRIEAIEERDRDALQIASRLHNRLLAVWERATPKYLELCKRTKSQSRR